MPPAAEQLIQPDRNELAFHREVAARWLCMSSMMKSSASFLPGQPRKWKESGMKINKLKQRLQKNRAMTTISLRIPEDVVDDLKDIAPRLGFSGYQPLIRAYIGQGLRADLERLNGNPDISNLVESLRRHGVKDEVIASALAEMKGSVEAA